MAQQGQKLSQTFRAHLLTRMEVARIKKCVSSNFRGVFFKLAEAKSQNFCVWPKINFWPCRGQTYLERESFTKYKEVY